MYTLEDDDETASRLQKQVLVGLAETQKHSDLLNARKTRLLTDDEQPTSPGNAINVAPVSADSPAEANEQDATSIALVGTVPNANPFFVIQEDDPTLPDFPDGADAFRQSSPPNPLPSTIQEASDTKSKRRAIAALTVACVAVFFTAMDQTVVVTALPKMLPDLQLA